MRRVERLAVNAPALVIVVPLGAERAEWFAIGRTDEELEELTAWLSEVGGAGLLETVHAGAEHGVDLLERPLIVGLDGPVTA